MLCTLTIQVEECTIIKVAGRRKQPGVSGMQHIGAGRGSGRERGGDYDGCDDDVFELRPPPP